jgi:hypothetical protein
MASEEPHEENLRITQPVNNANESAPAVEAEHI